MQYNRFLEREISLEPLFIIEQSRDTIIIVGIVHY